MHMQMIYKQDRTPSVSSPSLSLVEQPESASESEVGLAYGAVRGDELPEQPLDGARAVKALLGEHGAVERVGHLLERGWVGGLEGGLEGWIGGWVGGWVGGWIGRVDWGFT